MRPLCPLCARPLKRQRQMVLGIKSKVKPPSYQDFIDVEGRISGETRVLAFYCHRCSADAYFKQLRLNKDATGQWTCLVETNELDYYRGATREDAIDFVGSTASEWTKRHARGLVVRLR